MVFNFDWWNVFLWSALFVLFFARFLITVFAFHLSISLLLRCFNVRTRLFAACSLSCCLISTLFFFTWNPTFPWVWWLSCSITLFDVFRLSCNCCASSGQWFYKQLRVPISLHCWWFLLTVWTCRGDYLRPYIFDKRLDALLCGGVALKWRIASHSQCNLLIKFFLVTFHFITDTTINFIEKGWEISFVDLFTLGGFWWIKYIKLSFKFK